MAETEKPEKTLFERNTDKIREKEVKGDVGGRPDRLGDGPGERTGLGGGKEGGNRPGGPNDDAINQ